MGEGVPVAAKIVIAVVVVAVGLIVILVPMSFSALEYYEVRPNTTRAHSRWGAMVNPHAKVFDSPQHPQVRPQGMTLATE